MRIAALSAPAVLVLLLAGCSAGEPPQAAQTPSPVTTYDEPTHEACRATQAVTNGSSDAEFDRAAQSARGSASVSDVDALREIADKYDDAAPGSALDKAQATAAIFAIKSWCISHKVDS